MQLNDSKKYSQQYWMQKAIDLIRSEKIKVDAEIPVAALIVKDNVLVSEATNKTEALLDATAHAEIIAIREASKVLNNWRLNDCTLYTTLEPCAMCAGAIINSRISCLVFGAFDINAGGCTSVINLFHAMGKDNHIEVTGGILELEVSNILKNFFALMRS